MTPRKIIGAAALTLMMTAAVASAQATYPTTDTSTSANPATTTVPGTSNTGTTTVPGTPNTGAGGDVAQNALLLGSSAIIALAGIVYLATRKPQAE